MLLIQFEQIKIHKTICKAYAVVRKRKCRNNRVYLVFGAEKVGLAKEFPLVHKAVFGEEFVQVVVTARKRSAFRELVRACTDNVALV